MKHEAARGCQVYDMHEKNFGDDVTNLDLQSGELRLSEMNGLAGPTGSVLPPNERRMAEDRCDCYWQYVVTEEGRCPRGRSVLRTRYAHVDQSTNEGTFRER